MKWPEELLKRWLHPVVFAIWTVFLIYLLVSNQYVAFLRPEFGLLLAVAHFIAMGFMLAAVIRPNSTRMDVHAVLRALVLLVPVLYSVVMPDTMLGNQAFKKRFIGTADETMGGQAQSRFSSKKSMDKPDVMEPPGESESTQQETTRELTIRDIYLNPNFYKGQRVIITGMIMHDEALKPYFGGMDTAVYRFLINCCAADALPLAIALDSDQADAFANDQWVQVDGTFDLQQINGKPVPMVSKFQIKPVEAPPVPYLF